MIFGTFQKNSETFLAVSAKNLDKSSTKLGKAGHVLIGTRIIIVLLSCHHHEQNSSTEIRHLWKIIFSNVNILNYLFILNYVTSSSNLCCISIVNFVPIAGCLDSIALSGLRFITVESFIFIRLRRLIRHYQCF